MTRWGRSKRRGPAPVLPPLPPLAGVPSPLAPAAVADDSSPREEALRPTGRWRRIVQVAQALAQDRAARAALAVSVGYPPDAWDQFCRDIPLRPPPPAGLPPVTVLVDARVAAPFLLRATLRSLQDQSHGAWTAQVLAPPALGGHPVASFADTDPRIALVGGFVAEGPVALVDAGTALDPEALAWLGHALSRTGAAAAFADHDHGIADPGLRLVRADPMLFGAFDPALLAAAGAPALVMADARLLPGDRDLAAARAALLRAAARDRVAGVPRVLATRLALPLVARGAPAGEDDEVPGRLSPSLHSPPPRAAAVATDERIAIVIPTRDSPELLARAVETLRAAARDPSRLDIVVVDNRSAAAGTHALFARLAAEGAARTIAFDAPFNWSLASNTGAGASDAPLLAFVNDDIEMLAGGWDDALAGALRDPAVGAVGARLVYPDRTIQHAGVAFGFGAGGAEHEGRGVPAREAGPGGRYATPHAVSSVTGAFLGVRRGDFAAIGGFDAERLMIAHSDIDLCLRLRERGLVILYEPAIEAIHHEGATRGANATAADIAWDEGERADLLDRWGEALFVDPGISPYWLRGGAPFALLREPSMREILEHIDRTARAAPWRPARRPRP